MSNNWTLFKQRFQNYLIASGNDEKKDKVKIAMLLTSIGDDVLEVYNTFPENKEETLKSIIESFDKYFSPKKNVVYDRISLYCLQEVKKKVQLTVLQSN